LRRRRHWRTASRRVALQRRVSAKSINVRQNDPNAVVELLAIKLTFKDGRGGTDLMLACGDASGCKSKPSMQLCVTWNSIGLPQVVLNTAWKHRFANFLIVCAPLAEPSDPIVCQPLTKVRLLLT
jgi:hypothetical protein